MKVKLYYTYPEGEQSWTRCYGETEEELQKDIDLTVKRCNWNKKYCSIERED